MFYKQKGLEETEMGMAFNVMTLFKNLMEIAQSSTLKRLMIADMCEVWGISTQWMKWYYVDEESSTQQKEMQEMLGIQRTVIAARQLRPEISVRANGIVFLDTVVGMVTQPSNTVYAQKPLGNQEH